MRQYAYRSTSARSTTRQSLQYILPALFWAIKVGFAHLKLPSLDGKAYRGGLVLWRGGCQPSLSIQVRGSRLFLCWRRCVTHYIPHRINNHNAILLKWLTRHLQRCLCQLSQQTLSPLIQAAKKKTNIWWQRGRFLKISIKIQSFKSDYLQLKL